MPLSVAVAPLVRERRKDPTCGTSSTTCAIKAIRPTNSYRPICAVGTGASPGDPGVRLRRRARIRHVHCQRTHRRGQPADQATRREDAEARERRRRTVEAINSNGDAVTTKTAADGTYSLDVPAGRYAVRVDPEAGIGYHGTTTPASRTMVVKGDVGNVNFGLGRILRLEAEAEYSGFGSEHGNLIDLPFRQHKKLVGVGADDCILVCLGRAHIKGIVGHPWLRVAWRDSSARGGAFAVTIELI
jgi:hypothetical protein